MKPVVFLGPSLPLDKARELLDASYRPPAVHGDVIRAAAAGPPAIGLVDGRFERVPSVWHKEILWAMEQGIAVFGAASMGALRAAELTSFGMRGVGVIYEQLVSGALEDDDEVAVVHAEEAGYRALSVAMVDIRATLAEAVDQGVLERDTAAVLAEAAKALHYPDRIYPYVIARAAARGAPQQALEDFSDWLRSHTRSLKQEDAIAMLASMGRFLAEGAPPPHPSWATEKPWPWVRALEEALATVRSAPPTTEP